MLRGAPSLPSSTPMCCVTIIFGFSGVSGRQADGRTGGRAGGRADGRTDGRTDRQTDRQTDSITRECTALWGELAVAV